jgi:hypothetical protein
MLQREGTSPVRSNKETRMKATMLSRVGVFMLSLGAGVTMCPGTVDAQQRKPNIAHEGMIFTDY